MEYMFYNCKNLEYINLKNEIGFISLYSYENIFFGVPENIVYCINESNSAKISLILKNIKCSTYYCSDDWEKKQKKIYLINGTYECKEQVDLSTEESDLINIEFTTIINDINNFTNDYSHENSNNSINIITDYTEGDNYGPSTIDTTIINDTYNFVNNSNQVDKNNSNNISIDYIEEDNYREKCLIEIENINTGLTYSIISKYIQDYNNHSKTINKSLVNHYLNKNHNFTITIFKDWLCTNLLIEYDFFEINTSNIYCKINNSTDTYNNKNNNIFVYINHKYKNYLEIYNIDEKIQINDSSICPGLLEGNNLKIINNLTQEINSELGEVITSKIIENDIAPFNKNNPIFENICKNFTIEEIDIPIKERKQMIFLGNKEKELICNDINCTIESFFLKNLTGVCNCQISNDFNYVLLNEYISTNSMTQEEYQNYINSKSSINSFFIFKCGKEAFIINNLKINPGFYMSIAFFVILLILFLFYILNKRKINIVNSNPPKIQKFEIDDDLEEEEIDNNKNTEDNAKTQNIQEKNNQNKDNIIKIYTNSIESINNNENLNNYDKNDKKMNENAEVLDVFFQKEEDLKNLKKLNHIQPTRNRRSIKNVSKIQKTINTKESFIEPTVKQNIEKEEIPKQENKANKEVIIKSSLFLEYYWEFLCLKHPIINLFTPLNCLKAIDSKIPTIVKLMKIIFLFLLNIFFNIFHLEQKYFRKKYEYFNSKYNLRYIFLNKAISFNERLSYGFKNTIISGLISFLMTFIIQSIINYFFFNHKKSLIKYNDQLKKLYINRINNNKFNINENQDNSKNKNLPEDDGKKYIIFFSIAFIITIIIFYSFITFNEVYRGGFSDLLAATIWTFIFLQIIPFILCLVFALLKYIGIKNNNDKLYQFIYF